MDTRSYGRQAGTGSGDWCNEEVGGEGLATAEQMREVGTGVKMGEAGKWWRKGGKSEGICWMDGNAVHSVQLLD